MHSKTLEGAPAQLTFSENIVLLLFVLGRYICYAEFCIDHNLFSAIPCKFLPLLRYLISLRHSSVIYGT